MVTLTEVRASNAKISITCPARLVAAFVGGTSGIGEATLKLFAASTKEPRIYIVGRSQVAADRILRECETLNPGGTYVFRQADISLIRTVDEVCDEIKGKEKRLNLLFLSTADPKLDRRKTSEGLHLLAATVYYSRMRFITNLTPLLLASTSLRRVVSVGGGTMEGPINTSDFQAFHVPLQAIRGHLSTISTLGLASLAKDAPGISFVHDYPGGVSTGLLDRIEGLVGYLVRASTYLLGRWICVPLEESAERHLFLATSARFPASKIGFQGVEVDDESEVCRDWVGKVGGGVYSVGWNCDSASDATQGLLRDLQRNGTDDEVWRHTLAEYDRIMGD